MPAFHPTPSTASTTSTTSFRSMPQQGMPRQGRAAGKARRRAAVACYAVRRAVLQAVIRSCRTPAERRTAARVRTARRCPAQPSGTGCAPRTAPPGAAG
ncbi:hypothetical protein [Streptomyces sp. NPDC059649]|uniref:hypothetical protein n=1 Tax=Streptomyces sp. NPDC059649 TaxID=3346895 RepID=UPI00369E7943